MNILLIISDDLNAWIGALGRHPQAFTPNIDTLAKRGALFINAYCSAPYCNASRMGLFTGQLPSTLGVYANEPFWDAPERPETFMEILRKHGYYIFGAGKVFHGIFDYERAGSDGGSAAHWIEVQNRKEVWDEFVTNVSEPLPQHRPMNRLFDFSNFAGVPAVYHHFDWGALPDDVPETSLPDVKVTEAVEKFLRAPRRTPFFVPLASISRICLGMRRGASSITSAITTLCCRWSSQTILMTYHQWEESGQVTRLIITS